MTLVEHNLGWGSSVCAYWFQTTMYIWLLSSETVGHDIEGTRKDMSNGAGLGSNVQGGDAVGAIIWHRDLGDDQGDAQVPDGVPLSGGATDHWDDVEARGRRRVGVPRGR